MRSGFKRLILFNFNYICVQEKKMKHQITIEYTTAEHYSELSETDQDLVRRAYEVSENAYAPYSHFHVGAAAHLSTGEIILGSNQENIAYPSGLCAERVALFSIGANYPNAVIDTLVVVAKGDLIKFEDCVSPCGSCRQVMAQSEFRQNKPIRVVLVAQNGKAFIFEKASDLLVFPFGME